MYYSTTMPYPDKTAKMMRIAPDQAATEKSIENISTEVASFSLITSNLSTGKAPTNTRDALWSIRSLREFL